MPQPVSATEMNRVSLERSLGSGCGPSGRRPSIRRRWHGRRSRTGWGKPGTPELRVWKRGRAWGSPATSSG